MQRCVQRIVQIVRKQVTHQHLDCFNLKDSFGSLHVLCEANLFFDLVRKHNDPEDASYFRLFEFVVLGSQVSPEFDIVLTTFSSVWMILNAFSAIVNCVAKILTLLSLVLIPFPSTTMYSVSE